VIEDCFEENISNVENEHHEETFIGVYENFSQIERLIDIDILDFEVNTKVYLHKLKECYIIQTNEAVGEENIFSENGIVPTYKDDSSNYRKKRIKDAGNIVFPLEQTVVVGNDEQKVKEIADLMNNYDGKNLESKCFFSPKLDNNIKLYLGEYAALDESGNKALAVIEESGILYKLSFDGKYFESMVNFEINMINIIDYLYS
jgi:hypothetical protein